ncbi:glycosyltransferase family 39 protein [Archangium gephyra]|uniref:glycosyltransferase family 39 protein n=1 Tax=Archangium gephyra TaxID=48 RepID=UPI0035D48F43
MSDDSNRFLRWGRSSHALSLLVPVGICLVLGLAGGPPFHHPDSISTQALATVLNQGNPRFFNYPGLVIYVNAAAYGLVFLLLRMFGGPATFQAFAEHSRSGFLPPPAAGIPFTLPGHAVALVFSAIGLTATWFVAYRLTRNRLTSALAVLVTGTSLLWVQQSHMDTVDLPLAALCMLTLWLVLVWSDREHRSRPLSLALGAAVGLAASAKYNGAVVGIAILVAALAEYRLQPRRLVPHLLFVGLGAAAAFLACNPYIFVERGTFIGAFLYESRHAFELGHFGYDTRTPWLEHSSALLNGAGPVPVALALVGLLFLLREPSVALAKKLAPLAFGLAFTLVVFRSILAFDRYVMPLLPLVGVLAAIGMVGLGERVARAPAVRGFGLAVLVAAAFVPNGYRFVRHDWLLTRPDTRQLLLSLLSSEDPPVRQLLGSDYLLQWLEPLRFPTGNLQGFAAREALAAADLVVLDSFSVDRYVFDTFRPERRQPYAANMNALSGYYALSLSPYDRPKDEVPFANHSVYSPALPDLDFRTLPGPYIELYARDVSVLTRLYESCQRLGHACRLMEPGQGYYLRMSVADARP